MPESKKHSKGLVAKYFKRDGEKASEILAEVNALSETDIIQLASAIAREQNIDVKELAFDPISY